MFAEKSTSEVEKTGSEVEKTGSEVEMRASHDLERRGEMRKFATDNPQSLTTMFKMIREWRDRRLRERCVKYATSRTAKVRPAWEALDIYRFIKEGKPLP